MILFSFKEMVLFLQAPSNITDMSQSERGTRVNPRGSDSKLKVSLLASEWSSLKGGLSTINRYLAIQLGGHSKVEVTLLVPPSSCSEEEKRLAQSHSVAIREVQSRTGYSDPLDWLITPPKDLEIDVVVGHGQKLGKQAQFITESHGCKWIQVVHTSPEDLGMHKDYPEAISKGEEKKETEVELCKQADAVVAIGPKLKETFSAYLSSCGKQEDIIELTPGIFSEFSTIEDAVDNKNFRVLIFGRSDREDLEIKGYDIASKAIAELSDPTYRLIFVGAPDGKQEEIKEYLLRNGIPDDQLTVRKFVQSKEQLEELFREVDLCIMLSRVEGFGLTALEALSAGLPILVSGYSGFGEALCTVPSGKKVVVKSKEPKVWAKEIAGVRQKERRQRLREIRQIRRSYEEMYGWEKQCEILVKKMWDISYGKNSLSFVKILISNSLRVFFYRLRPCQTCSTTTLV